MTKTFNAFAPSNIAFIKYWGKREPAMQWPTNDSLSMTLSSTGTNTSCKRIDGHIDEITWSGQKLEAQDKRFIKAVKHLHYLRENFGVAGALSVSTSNTFPTGAGIASSASGFAALTIAALACWTDTSDWDALVKKIGLQRLAHAARMGSGSACRSVLGGLVQWQAGASPLEQSVTNLQTIAPLELADSIVLVDAGEKTHSSTEGHSYATSSPMFGLRLAGLPERIAAMHKALIHQDLPTFGNLLEQEALEMHSIMMTATPAIHYVRAEAWDLLATLRKWRQETGCNAYFTLDAGSNPHIISPVAEQKNIVAFLQSQYPKYTVLIDKIGNAPKLSSMEG